MPAHGIALFVFAPSHQCSLINRASLNRRRKKELSWQGKPVFACSAYPAPSQLSSTSPTDRTSGTKESLKTGTIIVPGKFDAFHLGHKELARVAATMGTPTLLSFSGMAEALKWPPRAPVVAPIERSRILRSWSASIESYIGWKVLPFPEIRDLSPAQFLDMLVSRFGATGLVCGKDWRFGKRAAGDVNTLLELAPERDLRVHVVDPVDIGDGDGVVSSSRVRTALANGAVSDAARLLGRLHRLVGYAGSLGDGHVDCGRFINQVPGDGSYAAIVRVIGRSEPFRTTVRVKRPSSADPMVPVALLDDPDAVLVQIDDAERIYCVDCEVYIDFEDRIT